MADILGFGRTRRDSFQRAHPEVTGPYALPSGGWWAWIPRQGGDRTEGTAVTQRPGPGSLDAILNHLEEILAGGGGLDGAAQMVPALGELPFHQQVHRGLVELDPGYDLGQVGDEAGG